MGSNPTFPTKGTPDFIGRFLIPLRGGVRRLSKGFPDCVCGVVLEDGCVALGGDCRVLVSEGFVHQQEVAGSGIQDRRERVAQIVKRAVAWSLLHSRCNGGRIYRGL